MKTPGTCQKTRSAPQKQPMPTTIDSNPAGNGGASGVPSTKWRSATGICVSRPPSAVSAVIMRVRSLKRSTIRLMRSGYAAGGPWRAQAGRGSQAGEDALFLGRCDALVADRLVEDRLRDRRGFAAHRGKRLRQDAAPRRAWIGGPARAGAVAETDDQLVALAAGDPAVADGAVEDRRRDRRRADRDRLEHPLEDRSDRRRGCRLAFVRRSAEHGKAGALGLDGVGGHHG